MRKNNNNNKRSLVFFYLFAKDQFALVLLRDDLERWVNRFGLLLACWLWHFCHMNLPERSPSDPQKCELWRGNWKFTLCTPTRRDLSAFFSFLFFFFRLPDSSRRSMLRSSFGYALRFLFAFFCVISWQINWPDNCPGLNFKVKWWPQQHHRSSKQCFLLRFAFCLIWTATWNHISQQSIHLVCLGGLPQMIECRSVRPHSIACVCLLYVYRYIHDCVNDRKCRDFSRVGWVRCWTLIKREPKSAVFWTLRHQLQPGNRATVQPGKCISDRDRFSTDGLFVSPLEARWFETLMKSLQS